MRNARKHQDPRGFSLIEMIGVLAVIVVLAGTLLPFLIKRIDQAVSDHEIETLKSFDAALQQSIMKTGYIPCYTNFDWANSVATELGVQVANVTTNVRRAPRYFLVDPAIQIGINFGASRYVQTDTGSVITNSSGAVIPPVNPRFMIVTSLGKTLTGTTLQSGKPTNTNDFSTIWNTADGSVPAATALSGWTGNGSDLKIERMNLSGLFVHLVLTTNNSNAGSEYSLTGGSYALATPVPAATQGQEGYYLMHSTLSLYNSDGTLDSQQVLNQSLSFVYNQNVWRGSLTGSGLVGGMDVAAVVAQFLAANHNASAVQSGNAQSNVVVTLISYLTNYDNWAVSSGFPAHNASWTAVNNAQGAMMTAVQNLYFKNGVNAPICP